MSGVCGIKITQLFILSYDFVLYLMDCLYGFSGGENSHAFDISEVVRSDFAIGRMYDNGGMRGLVIVLLARLSGQLVIL